MWYWPSLGAVVSLAGLTIAELLGHPGPPSGPIDCLRGCHSGHTPLEVTAASGSVFEAALNPQAVKEF